jgi:hypothetical protein
VWLKLEFDTKVKGDVWWMECLLRDWLVEEEYGNDSRTLFLSLSKVFFSQFDK